MTNDEIISSLRSCSDLVKRHGLDACASVMRTAADRLEEKHTQCSLEDGLIFKYNEATGEWDRWEVYMTVDCETEEDFEHLKQCVERQHALPPINKEEAYGMFSLSCPSCGNSVINYYNRRIRPPHCMMCGQKLSWEEDENEENSSI